MNRSPHTLFLISSSALFFSGIILLSYRAYGWGLLLMLGLLILYLSAKNNRSTASLFLFFLIGFLTFQCATGRINGWDISKESNILLNRSFLIFILVALAISQGTAKEKVQFYMRLPDWSKRISMPFTHNSIATFFIDRTCGIKHHLHSPHLVGGNQ
jgi:uncharacterized protein